MAVKDVRRFPTQHNRGRSYIDTVTGVEVDLAAPRPEMIRLGDITQGLSQTCRFGGQTDIFYSVAEHSVLCRDLVRAWGLGEPVQTAALLHDAHEAYVGDITSPMKQLLGDAYGRLVPPFNLAIAAHFGLDPALFEHEAVRQADELAVYFEGGRLIPEGGYWAGVRQQGHELPDEVHWRGGLEPYWARRLFTEAARDHQLDEEAQCTSEGTSST